MQSNVQTVTARQLPREAGLRPLVDWMARKMSERRVIETRRLTQQEIANLPAILQTDITTKHQEM